ncbi:MAG: M48 family metalloprotease [Chitinophagaceae bacterium]|jgi:beta-lactamase regulating signal transducer with metallopeptidase domain|nr:M48 family metalloprotease [Chitinophagaceae bacterium]
MPEIGHAAFLQSLGWALLNSLWQLAFLWVIYQVVFSFKTSSSPVIKSFIAVIFLTGGFAWFLVTLFSHLFTGSPETVLSSAFSAINGYAEINTWMQSSLSIASVLYLFLLFIPLVKFARNYRFVNQLQSQGQKKMNVEWRLFVQQVAIRLGIKKPVSIYISDLVNSPVTIGYIKPMILVPLAAVNRLTSGQMEAVLLHELAHIKRHDYLVNLWITFIQTILYFNPFVKLFIRQIEREREKSCDETVLHFQYDPHGYATALLMLEKTNTSFSIALAANGKKNDLLHRIETILGIQHAASTSIKKMTGIFAGLICIIAIQGIFIMSKPQKEGSENFALLNATNPFYFFTGEQPENGSALKIMAKTSSSNTVNEMDALINVEPAPANSPIPINENTSELQAIADNEISPTPGDYVYVNATEVIEPELTTLQEAQVEEIVEASRVVLEKAKWNEIEKNIADALTSDQKLQLQNVYLAELDKINWEKMEDRLRHSINNVDLEKMNIQLQKELTHFKLDSLVKEYSVAINTLNSIETYVMKNKEQEIIHPEISIPLIIEKRKALEVEVKKIKAIRDNKIIRL